MARFKRLQFKTAVFLGLIDTTAIAGCEETILVLAVYEPRIGLFSL